MICCSNGVEGVHTDVESAKLAENMYISPTGLVKLGDFGLARDVSVVFDSAQTRPSV